MATMKEARVHVSPEGVVSSKLFDVPIPIAADLKPDQVLIKVHISGSNPKDWKVPAFAPPFNSSNSGDDIAGTISAVGSNITTFHVGDRVAAFHEMRTPHGSFAEYAVAYEHTTFHIPSSTSFEEAATIPLAAMTAVLGLFDVLGVPEPWARPGDAWRRDVVKGGVVVYGASGAVGAFAVKILQKCGVHPIICVAGKGKLFVEGLIDKEQGDVVLDYREGEEKLVEGIKKAVVPGETLRVAFDAISEHGSYGMLSKVLDVGKGSRLALVLPGRKYEGIPEGIEYRSTMVGDVHGGKYGREIGCAWFRLFGLGLRDGWLTGHPFEVVEGGLDGVGGALQRLKDGEVSAKKLVFRVGETAEVKQEE